MTDREKLVALLMEAMEEGEKECLSTANRPDCRAYEKYSRDECGLALSALHLIANGVVVQRWIPVEERLPELHTKVLCCGVRGGRFIAELSTWGNGNLYWDKRDGKGCPTVTHWMPLPEPPADMRKGENG